MYIGSVRFFKHLILFLIALMIIVPTVGVVYLAIQNQNLRAQLSELQSVGQDNYENVNLAQYEYTYELTDWAALQTGHITLRIPNSEFSREIDIVDGVEIISFESVSGGATVSVQRFVNYVRLLEDKDILPETIFTFFLEDKMHLLIADFFDYTSGEILGRSHWHINDVWYYGTYGVTDLEHPNFYMRVFGYEGDFYIVMLQWDDDYADIVEPFFQSIQFWS